MSPLLKNARIIDSASKWNGKRADILIEKGRIQKIAKSISFKGKTIESKDLNISAGWIDMKVDFRDPGAEYKEDLESGLAAAKNGGFTSVVTMPGTKPVIDNKGSIEYLINRAKGKGVRIYPAGALSLGTNGEELAEMYDMKMAGAKLFTDGDKSIQNSGLMKKALLYAKNFNGVVSAIPLDRDLAPNAEVHEGEVSTRLGLEGIPHIAEEVRIKRDLDLLRYTDSRLHFSGLTTAGGVKLVKAAKKEGLKITAEVHLANLIWNENVLRDYDSNFKLMPPLRGEADRKALLKGVVDGTIDCISSHHSPEDIEHKKVEFGQAAFGMSSIESFFPLYNAHLSKEIGIERFVECLTIGPSQILGFESASIQEGKRAIFTCFDPTIKWTYSAKYSKAFNDPQKGHDMLGKVVK